MDLQLHHITPHRENQFADRSRDQALQKPHTGGQSLHTDRASGGRRRGRGPAITNLQSLRTMSLNLHTRSQRRLTSMVLLRPHLQKATKSQHQAMTNLKRKTNMVPQRLPPSHPMMLRNMRMNTDRQKLQHLATRNQRHLTMLQSPMDPMDLQPINQGPNTSLNQSINRNPNIGPNLPTMQSPNISPNQNISQNLSLPINPESRLISQDLFTNPNLTTSPLPNLITRRSPKRSPSQSLLINQI